jgi:peptidoglycan-associated lipoprotein
MKKNLSWIVILMVFALGLVLFSGCAEKKAVVKDGSAQEQVTAPPAAPDTSAQDEADRLAREKAEREAALRAQADRERAEREQAAKVQAAAPMESPVKDINFDYDKSNIRPDAREILKADADYLLKSGVDSITIEGHCDSRGTAEYNMALGERRARETKKYMVNLGVKDSKMNTISYGKERPLVSEENEEAWAKNRRAHFDVKIK